MYKWESEKLFLYLFILDSEKILKHPVIKFEFYIDRKINNINMIKVKAMY